MGPVDTGAVLGDTLAHQRLTTQYGNQAPHLWASIMHDLTAHLRLRLTFSDSGPFEHWFPGVGDAALTHQLDSIEGETYPRPSTYCISRVISWSRPQMMGVPQDERGIVWLDIDNTLYSASAGISHAMGERIHAYFVGMGLPDEEASKLHHRYYSQYGLAIRGLVRHHQIDPLDFDRKCDGSLPLEELLKPDPVLRKLLEDVDRTKVRVWGLTNAYYTHASRVLRILGVHDLIEDIVYCDYSNEEFTCKPEPEFYQNALKTAGVADPSKCYFVDDSLSNVKAARALGWGNCVHFCERGLLHVEGGKPKYIGSDVKEQPDKDGIETIAKIDELRTVWPQIFKQRNNDTNTIY